MPTRIKTNFFGSLGNITPSLSSDNCGSAICAKERQSPATSAPAREGSLQCWIRGLKMPEGLRMLNSFLLGIVTGMADRATHDCVSGNWGQRCTWLTHSYLAYIKLLGPLHTRWYLLHTVGPFHCMVLGQTFASSTTCVNKGKCSPPQSSTSHQRFSF